MHLVHDDDVVASGQQSGLGHHVGRVLRGERARPGRGEHRGDHVVAALRQGADVEVDRPGQVDAFGGLLAEQAAEPSHRVRQPMQAGEQVAHGPRVRLVVLGVVEHGRGADLGRALPDEVAQVGDHGRLRIVPGAVVQDPQRGGEHVGLHVGHGAPSLLAAGAADGQQHLHEGAAPLVVVGEQVLAGRAGEAPERGMDVARVERVDGPQAASQTDDLSAEQTDEPRVVGFEVAGDDRVHAQGAHAPYLASHERGLADRGQAHDEHAGLFDDAGTEPADRIAAHARPGGHAPSDGHALDRQGHIGAERPEAAAHLRAGAEELVDRGHQAGPAAAPAVPSTPRGGPGRRRRAGAQGRHVRIVRPGPVTYGGTSSLTFRFQNGLPVLTTVG